MKRRSPIWGMGSFAMRAWAQRAKTPRAAALLAGGGVGSAVTARCGDSPIATPARSSPPGPRPKPLAAAPLGIFRQALSLQSLFIALALLGLSGCTFGRVSIPPTGDRQLSQANRLARVAFERGSTGQAESFYASALKRARVMDNAAGVGDAAYNLALCQVMLGKLDQAEASLAEALTAFQRGGSVPGDVLILEAIVAQRQGKAEQSLALAGQVLSMSVDPSHHLQAWLLRGVIACEQREVARARSALAEAEQIPVPNPSLQAAKEGLAGSILLLEEKPAGAAAAFDRAAASFQEAKRYRAMGLTLRRAGEAYRQAGDAARAQDRLLRAQRSLAAPGEKAE